MDNLTLQKIKDALSKSNSIGIVVGENPSLDQMAAALAFYLTLRKVNKKVVVASPKNPIVEISSLVGIDKVQTSLGGDAGDLVVSFPYLEGEIEKVSYTLENEFLNIIVKAGENGLSFDEKDVKYIRGSGSVDLLFVIGTPRLSDLGDLLGGDKLRNAKIVNLDYSSENQGFGDIVAVSPIASSVSEQIGDLLLNLGLQIDQDAAQNLLNGIMEATNNFQNPNSSSLAFEIAGIVMQRGAKRQRDAAASSFMSRPQKPVQNKQQFEENTLQRVQKYDEEEAPEKIISQKLPQYQPEGTKEQHIPGEEKAPIDWLSPKVYKGSSNV